MVQSWAPVMVAAAATVFFAVYGFVMLVFPHRIRDRAVHPQSRGSAIALRIFGALLLFLSFVVIWAALQAGRE